ncbi:trypsin CFT-1-like [Leptidea sinapis]|uniref:trypsin CFT-1-like n=1 Tax=Leptidea sinapis TaxID=189913 RepID=UPI00211F52D0|nr:trypsin CFT-1-like [Leptidea sinapis]
MDGLMFVILIYSTVSALPQTKIQDGTPISDISAFPFAAALLRSNDTKNFVQACVGSIISKRSILTSVNCFYKDKPENWRVRVGSNLASSGGVVHEIESFLKHPDFDITESDNDVGIMRLSTAIVYGKNVQPVNIVRTNYNVEAGEPVSIIGWGSNAYKEPHSEELRKGDLVIINQDICRSNYNIIAMTVTQNMICAAPSKEDGVDFCDGDVGAPLLHNNTLVGIASFRDPTCGRQEYPGIYTRIAKYSQWIKKNK